MAIYVNAFKTVHLTADNDIADRKTNSFLIKWMLIEGVFLEAIMFYLTLKIQYGLDLKINHNTSKAAFILSVLSSGFEVLATLGDAYTGFCYYNGRRMIIEKVSLCHVLMLSIATKTPAHLHIQP